MNEEWRDVVGYEGLYQISNLGRVKSLARVRSHKRGHKVVFEKVLTSHIDKDGYMYFQLARCSVRKNIKAHKLIAGAFLGICPAGFQIDHINRNRSDNRIENLRYVSVSGNARNRVQKKTSIYVGVHRHSHNKKWISQIIHNQEVVYLGTFSREIDAARAYDKYVVKNKLQRELNYA